MAATAGVHRRDQLDLRRVGDVAVRPGNAGPAALQRLAQRLQGEAAGSAGPTTAASRSARAAAASRSTSTAPPAVQVQGLRQAVQRHQGHDLRQPQAADPRLPDGHRDLRERRQGRTAPCSSAAIWTASTRRRSCWRTSCARRWRPIRRPQARAMSRSTAPTSAATSSRRTARKTATTAACRAPDRQAPRRGRHARARRPHAAVRGQGRGRGGADHPPAASRPARPSTPMRRRAGMPCTPASPPSGSTTASRSRTTAPAPIRPRASSPACAAPRYR